VSVSEAIESNVWIVIPVHNRAAITRRCLDRLVRLGIPAWAQVLVVDDGSTDDSPRMLREEHRWARVLTGQGDWWWAGAIHAGMRHAISRGAGIVCWLNDDTLPDAGALEALVDHVRRSRGICGGVAHPAGPGGLTYGGGKMIRRWPRATQAPSNDHVWRVEWLHGNMVAMHETVWRRIGLPQTSGTIHNFADVEYSFTAFRHGMPVDLLGCASATAEVNLSHGYRSWRDPGLSWTSVCVGFWNPKVWWYFPGLVAFKTRLFGCRGLMDCVVVVSKALLLPFYKVLIRLMT
jgi:GT2 family glycosyltransferase